jgi:cell shape-determining protein MreD
MTWLNTIAVLVAAFLGVFWAAAFHGVRHVLGAQVDLLPALMVYASLCAGLETVALLALLGGLLFDSLSANPLGVSVLPLFVIGLALHASRELILRDQTFAQFVLGLSASAAAPAMTLLLLLTSGHSPLLGWGTLWQWTVMSVGGGIATPIFFELFGWLQRTLVHSGATQSSFRPDREIRRGRQGL